MAKTNPFQSFGATVDDRRGTDPRRQRGKMDKIGHEKHGTFFATPKVQGEIFRQMVNPMTNRQFRQYVSDSLPNAKLSGTKVGYDKGPAASKAAAKATENARIAARYGTPPQTNAPAKMSLMGPSKSVSPRGPGASMAASKASATAKANANARSAVHGKSGTGPGGMFGGAKSRSAPSRSGGPSRGPTSAPSRTAPSKSSPSKSSGGSKSYGGPR